MNQKQKRLSNGLSVFLFLCAAINFLSGQIGAAVCSLGAGMFYSALSSEGPEQIGHEEET